MKQPPLYNLTRLSALLAFVEYRLERDKGHALNGDLGFVVALEDLGDVDLRGLVDDFLEILRDGDAGCQRCGCGQLGQLYRGDVDGYLHDIGCWV